MTPKILLTLILSIGLMLACMPIVSAYQPVTLPATPEITQPIAPGQGTGYFLISSFPSGADVYFDGPYAGETPVTIPVSITGNPKHTITISLPGYDTYTQTYNGNPQDGQTITISATLTPSASTGQINVQSYPSGAIAYLDRGQSQTTPAYFTNVPVGSHEISVYLSGYQTYFSSVTVYKAQTSVVNAQLSPVVSTGTLSISSSPSGAAAYVDGIYQGITPTSVGSLAAGSHTVILSLAGYQDYITTATVQAGSVTHISATLAKDPSPIYGTVSLTSDPSGAYVYADGKYVGQTIPNRPLVSTQVTPGYHTLLLSKTGYQDYTTSGTVYAGQNLVLSVTLTPNPQKPDTGSIAISSSPTDADIYLDNVFKGITPSTIDSITPGTHSLLLKLNGYQDYSSQIQVTAGQTTQVSATMVQVTTPTPTPTTGSAAFIGVAAVALLVLLVRRKPEN
ncbi:hypothetical protein J2741_002180 [Methanolinea mesophila]|uniref:PEGA domain-containing protein n=1 Tax=Methanolinea mesophila TaxID=547055 RepID=UPI001AE39108|nr:PEGA domain-containing protein [Methanolinea mesophila]MBP1929633.1 hypothetical protein [Methanolinea mesophila]